MRVRLHLEQLETRTATSTYGFPYNVAALPGNSAVVPDSVKVSSYQGEAAGEAGPAEGQADLPWSYVNRLDVHLLRQYRAFHPKPKQEIEMSEENLTAFVQLLMEQMMHRQLERLKQEAQHFLDFGYQPEDLIVVLHPNSQPHIETR